MQVAFAAVSRIPESNRKRYEASFLSFAETKQADRLAVYLQLMRADKPIGTLLLLWPTLWALWVAAAGCAIHARWPYWLALVYAVWHQCGQYRAIRSRNREACFKVFLSNNRIGWALWLGLLAHYSGG